MRRTRSAQAVEPLPVIVWTPNESILSLDDMAILTGRKSSRLQIDALRRMQVPFAINLMGRPVVLRSGIEGQSRRARAEVAAMEEQFASLRAKYGLPSIVVPDCRTPPASFRQSGHASDTNVQK